MISGFSTPKKDKMVKVSSGEFVKTGQILARGLSTYKPGANVKGMNTLQALCDGCISFSKKKTPYGKVRTFISVIPKK